MGVIIVANDWFCSEYSSRAWCVFEAVQVKKLNKSVQVVLTTSAMARMYESLRDGNALTKNPSVNRPNPADCAAREEKDRVAIVRDLISIGTAQIAEVLTSNAKVAVQQAIEEFLLTRGSEVDYTMLQNVMSLTTELNMDRVRIVNLILEQMGRYTLLEEERMLMHHESLAQRGKLDEDIENSRRALDGARTKSLPSLEADAALALARALYEKANVTEHFWLADGSFAGQVELEEAESLLKPLTQSGRNISLVQRLMALALLVVVSMDLNKVSECRGLVNDAYRQSKELPVWNNLRQQIAILYLQFLMQPESNSRSRAPVDEVQTIYDDYINVVGVTNPLTIRPREFLAQAYMGKKDFAKSLALLEENSRLMEQDGQGDSEQHFFTKVHICEALMMMRRKDDAREVVAELRGMMSRNFRLQFNFNHVAATLESRLARKTIGGFPAPCNCCSIQ
jgi:hypothetical protein